MRLAQRRRGGFHMIIATSAQRGLVTGSQGQFPNRISFQDTSRHDSRPFWTPLARNGVGKGDMLYKSALQVLKRMHGL